MNSRIINRILFISTYLILANIEPNLLLAQTIDENRFIELNREIEVKNVELDSLRSLLDKRVELINIQKSKDNNDNKKLKELLSGSANLTNAITQIQLELNQQKEKIQMVSNKLYDFYSSQIDSLNEIENKAERDNNIITSLIEKRLRVSPKIDILSFEPTKVIDLNKSNLGERVYREFLTSASVEVENKLIEIGNLKNEINNIIALNEESVSFLEEADFDNDISYFRSKPKSVVSYSESRDNDPGGFENTIGTQAKSFSSIISQLKLGNVDDNKVFSIENVSKTQDLNEFRILIESVEQQLTDYKKVIDHKLKAK